MCVCVFILLCVYLCAFCGFYIVSVCVSGVHVCFTVYLFVCVGVCVCLCMYVCRWGSVYLNRHPQGLAVGRPQHECRVYHMQFNTLRRISAN